MKLDKVGELIIEPTKPFDFDATFRKPAHFATGDNDWFAGRRSKRWQTFLFEGKRLGVVFENSGSKKRPRVKVEMFGDTCLRGGDETSTDFLEVRQSTSESTPEELDSLRRLLRLRSGRVRSQSPRRCPAFIERLINETIYRYNLSYDLTDFYRRFEKDRVLAGPIQRLYGMRPGHQNSLYEYLVIGLVLQNCTVRRSVQMLQTLFENFGCQVSFAGKSLWCFWEPGGLKGVSEERLRELKLGYRAKSLKRIDDQFAAGLLDEKTLREETLERQRSALLALYGVGPATCWYLLFDIFHQYAFADYLSPWEQKIYSKLVYQTDPERPVAAEKICRFFNHYKPYCQLAAHYLWEDLWWRYERGKEKWLKTLIRT